MFLQKVHRITTLIAIWTIFLSATAFFISQADSMAGWDILSYEWEAVVYLIMFGFGSIAVGSTGISAVLSLYRLAEKE